MQTEKWATSMQQVWETVDFEGSQAWVHLQLNSWKQFAEQTVRLIIEYFF